MGSPVPTSDFDIATATAGPHAGTGEKPSRDLGPLRLDAGEVMTPDFHLPTPNIPVGSYTMAVRTGHLLFLSGHGAFEDGRPVHTGRLGETMTTEQGASAAEAVMLNLLATAQTELGDLSRLTQMIKVVVFVNSTSEFTEQHLVANGNLTDRHEAIGCCHQRGGAEAVETLV